IVLASVLASLVYPFMGTHGRIGLTPEKLTLDGMALWEKDHPGERDAVNWLRKNADPDDVLFEAIGPPYQHFARMATFSGRPTVLGWANHEWVWRKSGFTITQPRQTDIENLSKEPTAAHLAEFIHKYNVHWMILGDLERKTFTPELQALLSQYPAM